MNSRYDAIVIGAGMVGAAAALALARRQLRVALVEASPLAAEPPAGGDRDRQQPAPGHAGTF